MKSFSQKWLLSLSVCVLMIGSSLTSWDAEARRGMHNNTRTSVNVNRNRNVNRNTNVNVNRNVNVNVDNNYRRRNPVGTAVAVTAAAVVTAAVVGSIVHSLPPSCTTTVVGSVSYQQCGSTWYQPQYAGTSVQYVVVNPPR
jgi:hypothetical protein